MRLVFTLILGITSAYTYSQSCSIFVADTLFSTVTQGDSVWIDFQLSAGYDTCAVETDTQFIPDGSGVTYYDTLHFNVFNPTDTINSGTDLKSVLVNMEHSYFGDLDLVLKCPTGQTVVLFDAYGAGATNTFLGDALDDGTINPGVGMDYSFNESSSVDMVAADQAGTWIASTLSPGSNVLQPGVYAPEETFDQMIGCPLNGNWVFAYTDNIGADNGYSFRNEICFGNHFLNIPIDVSWTTSIGVTNPNSYETFVGPDSNQLYMVIAEDSLNTCFDTAYVSITVTTGSGCDSEFEYTVDSLSNVSFYNTSVGSGLNYYWEFGDGDTSSLMHPHHTYTDSGYFNVCLTIYNGLGCINSDCESVGYLNPGGPPSCSAEFYWYPDTLFNEIHMWNISSGGAGITYHWDFGDGATSTDPFPSHAYATNGTYYVCLTVTDALGCSDLFCDSVSMPLKTSGFTINVTAPTTNVNENLKSIEFDLFPNPTSNLVKINLGSSEVHRMEVFTLSGSKMLDQQVRRSASLDVANWSVGMYLICLTNKFGVRSMQKLVVE